MGLPAPPAVLRGIACAAPQSRGLSGGGGGGRKTKRGRRCFWGYPAEHMPRRAGRRAPPGGLAALPSTSPRRGHDHGEGEPTCSGEPPKGEPRPKAAWCDLPTVFCALATSEVKGKELQATLQV